jgi:hypothetical protein
MKPYATWKYAVLIASVLFGLLYAAPTLYGADPAVQISQGSSALRERCSPAASPTRAAVWKVRNGSCVCPMR